MSPQPTIQPPAPPTPPAIPGGEVVSSRVFNAAPMSSREVDALLARRKELSDQLVSADGRRNELSRQARRATGADKAGLEQRIGVLDARLARLESEIDETGRQLAAAPAALTAATQHQRFSFGTNRADQMDHNLIPIVAILSVFVFFPLAIAYARNMWRRASLPPAAGMDRVTAERLERMEQAMDAIAIEVERISEGQRFVTRVLGEQRPAAVVAAVHLEGEARTASSGELRR